MPKDIDLQALFDGYCVLRFRYPDGSMVQSLTSLNPEILQGHGLAEEDDLFDLGIRRPIPTRILDMLCEVVPGQTAELPLLDEFLEVGGKLDW